MHPFLANQKKGGGGILSIWMLPIKPDGCRKRLKKGLLQLWLLRALKIILTNVVLCTYHQRSFQWAKFEAKLFSDAKSLSYLNVPSPPPKYKQTNLQILYHFSTRKMAYGLFHIFDKLRSIVSQFKEYYTLVPKEGDIQWEYTE